MPSHELEFHLKQVYAIITKIMNDHHTPINLTHYNVKKKKLDSFGSDFKIMNGSLTTLSPPVIGDWGLSNVFSSLNVVKQFLILTCLVLCLRQIEEFLYRH